jgi:hypothetical protein
MDDEWQQPATHEDVEPIVDAVIRRYGLPDGMDKNALVASTRGALQMKLDEGCGTSCYWLSVFPAALIAKYKGDHKT